MRRLLRISGLVLVLGLGITVAMAQTAPVIPVGTPVAEVIREFGPPKSKLTTVDREVLVYPTFEVTLHEDRVTKVSLVRALTTAAPAAEPRVVAPDTSRAPAPRVAAPLMEVTPVTIFGVLGALWPVYLIFVLLLPVAEITRRLVKRHRRGKAKARQAEAAPPEESPTPAVVSAGSFLGVALTTNLLQRLEWKRFEQLVSLYFTARGLRIAPPPADTDPEVGLCLYREEETKPYAYVQCRTAVRREIELKDIERFLGIMVAAGIDEGVVITSAVFSPDARKFAEAHGITAINGLELITHFQELPPAQQQHIVTEVTLGDYATPTCPKCDLKLELRGEGTFWGCVNWPQCRTKIFVRRTR